MTSRQKTGAATLHAVANSATSVAVSEQSVPEKPRLVFFQYRYDERLPAFLLLHTLDHVKCLSQFFDVTVIREDCDYDAVCDRYEPAVTLFEAGVNHVTCRRPNIANTAIPMPPARRPNTCRRESLFAESFASPSNQSSIAIGFLSA